MQQTTTLLVLGENNQLTNYLVSRLASMEVRVIQSTIDSKEEETQTVRNISSIVVTSDQLSNRDELLLKSVIDNNSRFNYNPIRVFRIVSLHDSILNYNETKPSIFNIFHRSISKENNLIETITIHAPLFYEDLITNRELFFINNVNTNLNIVKYYGDSEMRIPLISRENFISYIVNLILYRQLSHTNSKTDLFIRGDYIRLETIVMSLFGREFQYENVRGRPGENQLASKWSKIVEEYENTDDFCPIQLMRWREFLTH